MIVIEYEEVTDKWHWDRWKMLMERIGSVSVEGKRQFRWNRTGSKPASKQPQKVQRMSKGQGSPIDCTERSGFKHKFDSVHTSQAFSLSILIARSHETDLWKCPISCFNPFFLSSFSKPNFGGDSACIIPDNDNGWPGYITDLQKEGIYEVGSVYPGCSANADRAIFLTSFST